jgi:RDD family
MMLSSWGTTPGKALSKIQLRCQNGSKLSYSQALNRSFLVAVKGLGLGLPLISLVTLVNSYNDLTKNGKTSWDRDGNFSVSHQIIGLIRGLILISILLLYFVLITLNYSAS